MKEETKVEYEITRGRAENKRGKGNRKRKGKMKQNYNMRSEILKKRLE